MDEAIRWGVPAFMLFLNAHWLQIHTTNPLKRLSAVTRLVSAPQPLRAGDLHHLAGHDLTKGSRPASP